VSGRRRMRVDHIFQSGPESRARRTKVGMTALRPDSSSVAPIAGVGSESSVASFVIELALLRGRMARGFAETLRFD
jgi:hypothetical protein